VRYKVLGYNRPNEEVVLPGLPWMQSESKSLRLHLNADQSLTEIEPSRDEGTVLEYQADAPGMNRDDDNGELLFTHIFSERTIVVGPSRLTVHLSAEKQNDLDVYVMLRKADANGVLLQNINQPLADLGVSTADKVPSVAVLKYLGPQGILRASKRAVDSELSSSWWRTLSHEKGEKVPRGSVVKLQIDLWPTGMIFEQGEKLVLKISGHDMRLVDFEMLQGSFQVVNEGKHYIHLGGGRDNHLDLHIL
jgi:predicted acyl esterase